MARDPLRAIADHLNGRPPRAGGAILVAVVARLAAMLAWARLTEIDDVTRAAARIVPSCDLQAVQASETGTIPSIDRETGDIVEAGAVPMRLDPTLLTAQLEEAEAVALEVRRRAEAEEIDDQAAALRSKLASDAHAAPTEMQTRQSALRTRIPALGARLARAELRAPARGIVNRVLFATLGGIARQGRTVAEIVPLGEVLTAGAYVAPEDIAFIRPDQHVKVRPTAYDASRDGALDGRVTRIGADTVKAPEGERDVCVVAVENDGALTSGAGAPLAIIPGMVAQVDMLSEPRTVPECPTRPVVRVKDRASRE